MPLYKTITVDKGISIYIWKVEETLAELQRGVQLSDHCQQRFTSMKSLMHQRAFMSIRHLLAQAHYTDQDLLYNSIGKPLLRDGKHISITHSYNFTGIILSKTREVGIDIEMQRDKILRIAPKFTPIQEYKTLANDDALIRKLTIVWGAKESIYKIYNTTGLSFLQHINVTDFDFDTAQTTAKINYHGKESDYKIHFTEFEGFTLAYALKTDKS